MIKIKQPLAQDKKLTIIFRVEPGCLGPKGKEHVESFCALAQKEVMAVDADFVHWEIIPRYDKSLPEMQYKILSKNLSIAQTEKYLALFGKTRHEFEDRLNTKISLLINQFMKY